MPETLFQRDVKIKRVTTIGYSAAQGLNDPVRIKILEILSHKQMSVEEVAKVLGSAGYKKAITTVRHHLDTLKSSGLVEATKMIGVRGAVMKYYAPTLRVFSYDSPDLDKHTKLVEETGTRLLKVLKSIINDKKFVSVFSGKVTCNQCKGDHYKEYVALEILNAALARAMERKEYAEMIAQKGQPKN